MKKMTHSEIANEYFKFCFSIGEYDDFIIKKILLLGTLTRFFLYTLSCFDMIVSSTPFMGIFVLVGALLCSFLNGINFVYTLILKRNKGINDEKIFK